MADLSGAPLRSSLIFFGKHLLNRRFILSDGFFVDRQNLFRATVDKIVWFFELTAEPAISDELRLNLQSRVVWRNHRSNKNKKATKHGPCR
jgi:hypothetical protein